MDDFGYTNFMKLCTNLNGEYQNLPPDSEYYNLPITKFKLFLAKVQSTTVNAIYVI